MDMDPPIQHAVMEREVYNNVKVETKWSKGNEVTIYYYGVGSEGATGAPPCCASIDHTHQWSIGVVGGS